MPTAARSGGSPPGGATSATWPSRSSATPTGSSASAPTTAQAPTRSAPPRRSAALEPTEVLVGSARLHRFGVVLRIPAGDGRVVVLVEEQPRLLAIAVGLRPHEHEAALQLLALEVEVEFPVGDRPPRIVALGRLPRPPVPHDHVAGAVAAFGDHALEVEVVERMVFDMDGQPPGPGVERRALGHGPAGQDPADLEPEVVVQPAGPVAVHDEPVPTLRGPAPPDPPGWLRGTPEVALGLI